MQESRNLRRNLRIILPAREESEECEAAAAAFLAPAATAAANVRAKPSPMPDGPDCDEIEAEVE